MPIKVAFMQLSSCWGCHQSLLNAHLGLLSVLPELEIVYWPAVVDFKHKSLEERKDGEIVVGFLEGMVRTETDLENVKLMRKKSKIIVCLGTCACYGNVAGLANLFDLDELTHRKFVDTQFLGDKTAKVPTKHVPKFMDHVINIKYLIDVDVFIYGCPPTTDHILAGVTYLLSLVGEVPKTLNKKGCVCDTCVLAKKGCFLDEGTLCYGPITAAGCSLMCPNKGDVCYGCFKATGKPGSKADKLKSMIHNVIQLTSEEAASVQHFLDLYLGTSNIANFYFRGDLLQKLAYEPNSFKTKEIKVDKEAKMILDVNATGVALIDEIIGTILFLLKGDPNFKYSSKTVCSHCDRVVVDKVPTNLKRDYEGLPTMDKCFLEQGYICLGPVTHAGCGTLCPNRANSPCLGCYGPPIGVREQGAKFISTLGSLTSERDPEEVLKAIKDPAGLFNRYTLADSTLGYKRHDKITKEEE